MRNWLIGIGVVALAVLTAALLWEHEPSGARSASTSPTLAHVVEEVMQHAELESAETAPEGAAPRTAVERGEVDVAAPVSSIKFTARVTGRCLDRRGLPIGGVAVSRRKSESTSAVDGTFVLDLTLSKPSRRIDVAFSAEGYGDREVEVRIDADETVDLGDVGLDGAAVVFGRVTSVDGAPLGDAKVQIENGDGKFHGSRFTGPDETLRKTKTAADGTFRFERVAPGSIRLWAGLSDYVWSWNDAHELETGEEHEVRLRLVKLESEDTIDLLVLDPDGKPVSRAQVLYRYSTSGSSGSGTTQADENGRLRMFLDPRSPRSFIASHPDDLYGSVSAPDVQPGTHDLVMQLTPLEVFGLTVTSSTGVPVERFSAKLQPVEPHYNSITAVRDTEPHTAGRAEVAKPPFEFKVVVRAEGFAVGDSAFYKPATMPASVTLRLDSLPAIRGMVTGEGRALEGAEVSLHRATSTRIDEGNVLYDRSEVNGFMCRSEKSRSADGTAGANGQFELTLRRSGRFYLRASADGFASSDIGPFELDPVQGATGLDIELARGGVIEGRVLVNPGQKLEGWIIGASRADGFGVTQRTGETGEFRFDGLAAGRWLVEQRETAISRNSTTARAWSEPTPAAYASTCDVFAGVVTTYDVDLRSMETATLVGRLLFGGKAPKAGRGWTARLTALAEHGETHEVSLDSDGRFRFVAQQTGAVSLNFSCTSGSVSFGIHDEVELIAGERIWEHDFPVGALEVRTEPEAFDWTSQVSYKWEGAGRLSFEARLIPSSGGSLHVSPVPAGLGVLRATPKSGVQSTREVVVPTGGTASVQVP